MKKSQREPYLILTKVELPGGEVSLCCLCRFGEQLGDCGDGIACCHPLGDRWGFPTDAEEGNGRDCWGFRPLVSPEVAADMVGIWLQGMALTLPDECLLGKRVKLEVI